MPPAITPASLPATTRPFTKPARRHDLDWLRVIAFVVLVFFHAAVVFLPEALPLIVNPEPSTTATLFVSVLHPFRLPLLFLVAGAGVALASRSRGPRERIVERSRRLLVPLVFGILVLVPPMVFLEKHFIGVCRGSFLEFYPRFFTEGIYPAGHLSWHHLWFLAYLYLYCLMLAGIESSEVGRQRLSQFGEHLAGPGGLWLPLVLMLGVELTLRPFFGGTRDLVNDQANFWLWFIVFITGHALARRSDLRERCERLAVPALAGAIVAAVALHALWFDPAAGGRTLHPGNNGHDALMSWLPFATLRITMIALVLLAAVGFASRWLDRPGRLLARLNAAVFPLYCLHLPITVALAYLVVPTALPIGIKYALIALGTLIGAGVVQVLIVERWPAAGVLVGYRPARRLPPGPDLVR